MDTVVTSTRTAVVIGAGIAGITTSIALARRGWAVEIIELSPDGRTAGWGLSLTGPSLRALDSLQLCDEMVVAGYGMSRITNWEPNGDPVEISPPQLLGPGSPAMAGIPRPELHRILAKEAALLGVTTTYGSSVASIRQNDSDVELRLDSGATRLADVAVGADGIRSQVRGLLGISDSPSYTGQAIWRAKISRPEWATGINTFSLADRQIGVVPIGPDAAYVFFTENRAPRDVIPDELLAAGMYEHLAPFTGLGGELRDAVRDSTGVVRRLAQTLIVESPWNVGRVVLVGDACHAPSPQMASGAALAIEDGVVLAEELDAHRDVPEALVAFSKRRLERCSILVKTSARIAEMEQSGQHRESHALINQCHGIMAQPA